jgi:hypothetical protein
LGKPIQKKWFGLATILGPQIVVNGVKFADGTTSTSAYILKQTGSTAYIVQDTALAHAAEIVFMVNATSTGALLPGQCFILATPFGGSPLPCAKISQFRLSLYEAGGTIDDFSWSTQPAVGVGQADLISGTGAVGAILTITPGSAGFGYFTAPSVSFTGGGIGAAATSTVSGGVVTGYTLLTSGSGYATGAMTVGAPPAFVTATATVTQTIGAINTPAVVLGGGYYDTAPTTGAGITITGATTGSGADVTAVLTNGAITSFVVNNAGSSYDSPVTITIGNPATVNTVPHQAVATATASATISV